MLEQTHGRPDFKAVPGDHHHAPGGLYRPSSQQARRHGADAGGQSGAAHLRYPPPAPSGHFRDGERYRLAITEQKTGKARVFTVPLALYQFIRCYCLDNGIGPDEVIFPLTERAVQKQLRRVCDYLGYASISTHSFRKFYATEIYRDSGYNIALVQQLLQHSSAAVTQRYIGIQQKELEEAIEGHLRLDV